MQLQQNVSFDFLIIWYIIKHIPKVKKNIYWEENCHFKAKTPFINEKSSKIEKSNQDLCFNLNSLTYILLWYVDVLYNTHNKCKENMLNEKLLFWGQNIIYWWKIVVNWKIPLNPCFELKLVDLYHIWIF